MFSHRNLRVRISIAFFSISMVLSGLFAVATFLSFELVRPWYTERRFADDFEDFVEHHRSDPQSGMWQTDTYRIFVADRGDLATLPARLRSLEPGRHQIEREGEPSELQVEDRGGLRYLIEYESDQILAIEGEITRLLILLLGSGVMLTSLLALVFGYRMSRRIVEPVTSLARRVEALDAQQEVDFPAGAYGTDEVADLARAFERYLQRLSRFVQREKDFAADASHELRTSAASISSGIELLMTEDHGEPTRARLLRLRRSSRHMIKLIEALLVLAREDTAADQLAPRADASAALREIVDGRQQAAASRGVDLTLDVARAGDVAVSTEGLSIAVGNLIDNAIAYAPDGAIRVSLDGNIIEIVDDGPGIPEHELPYVFQRAFRGRQAAGRGAGLGLSIVKRLCEHYGWLIEIDSTSGAGTVVRIDFAPTPRSELA